MFTNTRKTRIEWGDCDPAGIIFYARYFEIFDVSTTVLIERALGMKKIEYLKAYDFPAIRWSRPGRDFGCRRGSATRSTIETTVVACGRSSFKIEHRLTHDGALAVEGFETRVWVVRDPDDPKRMKSQPIPAEVVARLTHASLDRVAVSDAAKTRC